MDDDLLGTTITCFGGTLSAERADRRTPLRVNRASLIVGQPGAGSSDPFRLGAGLPIRDAQHRRGAGSNGAEIQRRKPIRTGVASSGRPSVRWAMGCGAR